MISSLKQNRCISETEQDRSKLLLITNRKSHTRFRLVPKSTTFDELELTLNGYYAFRCITHVFRSPPQKNVNEDRPILSATKMLPKDRSLSLDMSSKALHLRHNYYIIIIIIIINERINVAYSPKTSRTRNKQTKENSDVFGRWKHSKSQRH